MWRLAGRPAPTPPQGTGLVEQLSGADLASAVDGFDAHLADALADFEEDSHSSSEEDLENGPVL